MQVGGRESLKYRSEFGETLDLGPYNLHAVGTLRD